MPNHAVETYLKEMRRIRFSGAAQDEQSYYTPLSNLLDAVGSRLRPRVKCVLQLRDTGADHPDGGLFTEEQLEGEEDLDQLLDRDRNPARGALEVKPHAVNVDQVVTSTQVAKYWRQ